MSMYPVNEGDLDKVAAGTSDDDLFFEWQKNEPVWRRLNPCDLARYDWLAPLGDLVAKLTPPCPCCAGFRMIAALAIGFGLGAYLL